jgi:hypothetical protein
MPEIKKKGPMDIAIIPKNINKLPKINLESNGNINKLTGMPASITLKRSNVFGEDWVLLFFIFIMLQDNSETRGLDLFVFAKRPFESGITSLLPLSLTSRRMWLEVTI